MNEGKTVKVVFSIRRFIPEKDSEPHYENYDVDVEPGMTILDSLHQIKERLDSTLSWRFSCRMGVCGSCAMLINGRPALACNTQVLDISSTAITLAPLPNFDIVRDLVPDLAPLFEKHIEIKPFIVGPEEDTGEKELFGEYIQTPGELTQYLQFTYCIKCGACMAACPTFATDPDYNGPQPLAQTQRYNSDTRDAGFEERKKAVGGAHGAFRCHYAGECSNVCPKGVDPARAIQLLKRSLVLDYLKLRKDTGRAPIKGAPENATRREEIPDPPAFTVEQK